MSKKAQERKFSEEQKATGHAFQEFLATFQNASGPPKTFVKSGILHANFEMEDERERGTLYNPKQIVKQDNETVKKAIECARLVKTNKSEHTKRRDKPKSNLELLKEELRLKHLERNEQRKSTWDDAQVNVSIYKSDDETSTNLFVANLNPNVTKENLMHMFGVYGPLANVSLTEPRTGNDIKNLGFVAFMSRRDAERALENLKNRANMKIGWATPIVIPAHPVYVPPDLLRSLLPPPQTGLPFNAQPKIPYKYPQNEEDMNKLLYCSTVKVTIPLDKQILGVINRMVEFVIREGPLFEAMIMNKEIDNPTFRFLFDNKSSDHIYYRWKLYSMLHGESPHKWSTKEFRMFKGGSVWTPPPLPDYTLGMPDYFFKKDTTEKKLLSLAQETRLITIIQNLTMARLDIGEAMVFCINHEEAAKEVMEIISESFENDATAPWKKISRLYLVSDVLYNSGVKRVNGTRLLADEIEKRLRPIFEAMRRTYKNLKTDFDKNNFKLRVFKVIQSWGMWKILKPEKLRQLEKLFLKERSDDETDDSDADEPLDGKNMIKRYLQNNENEETNSSVTILSDMKRKIEPSNPSDFIRSRWESVKPEEVEAQAMSTKKMFELEMEKRRRERKHDKEQEKEHVRKIEVMRKQLSEIIKNKVYKARYDSSSSTDSSSSDEERKQYKKSKSYKKKKYSRDKDRYNKRYRK